MFFIKPNSLKWQNISALVISLVLLFVISSVKAPFSKYVNADWNSYCKEYLKCSQASMDHLLDNNLAGNDLLTLYNWGGWIIWNYPDIKPTVDGRMHLWRDGSGYSGFAEYYAIEQNQTDVDDSRFNTAFMSPTKPIYNRLRELVKQGKWKLVYEDKSAGIFVRK